MESVCTVIDRRRAPKLYGYRPNTGFVTSNNVVPRIVKTTRWITGSQTASRSAPLWSGADRAHSSTSAATTKCTCVP